ncbi:hypothetical protein G6F65_018135 [Rhizopus arrhizus]|nr:hypothetical protein G6F65_018135 [Rhizopus arrhizus]
MVASIAAFLPLRSAYAPSTMLPSGRVAGKVQLSDHAGEKAIHREIEYLQPIAKTGTHDHPTVSGPAFRYWPGALAGACCGSSSHGFPLSLSVARATPDARRLQGAQHNASLLEAIGLTKRYGDQIALHPLHLRIEPGEIYCLLGANGAGKTTTINLFLNFIQPDGGQALIHGLDVVREPLATKQHVAYIPEQLLRRAGVGARTAARAPDGAAG